MRGIRCGLGAGLAAVLLSGVAATPAAAAPDTEAGAARYALDGGVVVQDRVYVWRIDRRTGRVSLCRSEPSATTPSPKPDMDTRPVCTPWSD